MEATTLSNRLDPALGDLFKWGRSDWGKIWWLKKSRSAGEILVGLPAVEPCGFTRPNTNSGSCLWRGSGSTCLSVGFEFGCQIHTRLWKDSDSVELRSAETCKDIFLRPLVAIDFLINQVPESLPLHMKTFKRVLEAPHCSFLFLSLLISVCSWFFLFFLVQGRTLLKREIGLHGVWTLWPNKAASSLDHWVWLLPHIFFSSIGSVENWNVFYQTNKRKEKKVGVFLYYSLSVLVKLSLGLQRFYGVLMILN